MPTYCGAKLCDYITMLHKQIYIECWFLSFMLLWRSYCFLYRNQIDISHPSLNRLTRGRVMQNTPPISVKFVELFWFCFPLPKMSNFITKLLNCIALRFKIVWGFAAFCGVYAEECDTISNLVDNVHVILQQEARHLSVAGTVTWTLPQVVKWTSALILRASTHRTTQHRWIQKSEFSIPPCRKASPPKIVFPQSLSNYKN